MPLLSRSLKVIGKGLRAGM